ncbi:hypothetical protein NDA11_003713 [Ustilago hordei]|uniref:Secreted protein n=1 Tax=Ustilago hordei TaxID=120017 RepID=I2G0J7_USTHO|nr:uncharacterized protein UHO2_03509 [Ustilago hordei]KAJ1044295.1 hypothetical protein NDA10_008021 [Ustilago hordei]KAJ1579058.1 hypothetical protein NDA15_005011 [Ustilago hordei]KAJ1580813.1 hypothetical protein NDA12_007066 [Ustilago hordei]KAJ1581458.1 hypothetical protein NDA11_003713 [Ustilago hordei]KAJ1595024.1 hypothetical protein NDA14_007904 [Ustilago hordei]
MPTRFLLLWTGAIVSWPSATSLCKKKCAMLMCFVLLKCCGSLAITQAPDELLYKIGMVESSASSPLHKCSTKVLAVIWIAEALGKDWSNLHWNMDAHSISLATAPSATYSASTELFAAVS